MITWDEKRYASMSADELRGEVVALRRALTAELLVLGSRVAREVQDWPMPDSMVVLGPTDRLAIAFDRQISRQEAAEMQSMLRAKGWDADRVLFVSGPAQLAVVPEGADVPSSVGGERW